MPDINLEEMRKRIAKTAEALEEVPRHDLAALAKALTAAGVSREALERLAKLAAKAGDVDPDVFSKGNPYHY